MDKVEKAALNLMIRVTSVECWMQQPIAVEKEQDCGEKVEAADTGWIF